MLKREEILSKKDLKKQKVTVPEWDGDVFVSEMTGAERDDWEQILTSREENKRRENLRARLVCATVTDEEGNKIFSKEDAEFVGRLSAIALGKICKIAQELNGMTSKELDDAEKN